MLDVHNPTMITLETDGGTVEQAWRGDAGHSALAGPALCRGTGYSHEALPACHDHILFILGSTRGLM